MSELSGPDPAVDFDAVVLAGGSAARLGGADKPSVEIGGRTLLEAALDACAAAGRTVVVGPPRSIGLEVRRDLLWTREEPAGAGPAAALAAGIAALANPGVPAHPGFLTNPGVPTHPGFLTNPGFPAHPTVETDLPAHRPSDYTIVLAADLPFIDAEVIHNLWTTLTRPAASEPNSDVHPDGAVAVDESGRAQWLTACYRRSALVERIHSFPPDQLVGLSLRRLLAGLHLIEVEIPARAALDCDTWEQIESARRLSGDRRDHPAQLE